MLVLARIIWLCLWDIEKEFIQIVDSIKEFIMTTQLIDDIQQKLHKTMFQNSY